MKTRIAILIAILSVWSHSLLADSSVKFVRSIDLKGGSEKTGIASLLFGRKQQESFNPSAIARLASDRYSVVDTVHATVLILDTKGKIHSRITHANKQKLISPVCVSPGSEGQFYVSDSALGRVFLFDKHYKFENVLSSPPGSRITGIDFADGILYCADTQGHRIFGIDERGKVNISFGSRGSGFGEFNFPTHITTDSEYIYVTDAMNFRVQIFDRSGKFVKAMGTQGRGGGNFSKPKGIAVDEKQRIFVADAMFDNIQIFDFNGNFLYYFGGPGHLESEFWMPSGIMVNSDQTIWVADTYNSRIQIFQVLEELP